MTGSAPSTQVLILGGTSKVWRLMQPYWRSQSQSLSPILVAARRAAAGVDVILDPTGPVDFLPQCKAVISLWAKTAGSAQDLAQNRELARRTMEIARSVGADRVLHASTGAVYTPSDQAICETCETVPRHHYGKAKLDAEIEAAGERPFSVFFRLGNVAGADSLFAALRRDDPLILDQFPDGGGPARSYVAPDDLVRVLADFVHRPADSLPNVVNVAGPQPVRMEEIARACHIDPVFRPAPPDALAVQYLDVSLLRGYGHELTASSDPGHLAKFVDAI